MTDTEVAVKFENHEQEIKSLKHRMNEQEEQGKSLTSLALSVQKMALSMESMIDEQKKQGERLSKLEAEPAERARPAASPRPSVPIRSRSTTA